MLGAVESDCSPWMEGGLFLRLRRTAAVVLGRAVQLPMLAMFPLLVMLRVLVLAMQLVVLVVVIQLLGYRRQTLPSRYRMVCVSWHSF